MKVQSILQACLVTCAMGAMPLVHAANMSRDQYSSAKTNINDTYKTDKAACDGMKGNAKDVCVEEAKAKRDIAKAEAEYNYTGKASDQAALRKTTAKANYAVAKEKCDDLKGNQKDVCVKEAKATRDKALADTKMVKKEADARADDRDTKRDADYKVAAEKCDAMSGDAKSTCVNNAKVQYGKK